MIKLIEDGTISSKIAKKVFKEIITNGSEPKNWVEEKGLVQLSDPQVLEPIITAVWMIIKNQLRIIKMARGGVQSAF